MRRLTQWSARIELFDPRGPLLAAGRSLLGLAQLSILLANPPSLLFGATPQDPAAGLCRGSDALTLWCAAGSGGTSGAMATAAACIVLAGVTIGFAPKWLCIPHWYVAFSLGTRVTANNGGDAVAQILVGLLVPCCLGDTRRWHWRRPREPLAPAWRGASCAAHLLIRAQILVIYADAAIAKLGYRAWRDGTVIRILFEKPGYALPSGAGRLVDSLLAPAWISGAVTRGVILLELGIALSMLGPGRVRRWGLGIAVCLHVAIIVALGLFSFGLVMIASVMIAAQAGVGADTRTLREAGDRASPQGIDTRQSETEPG